MLIQGWQIQAACAASQSNHQHCITALVVWRKAGAARSVLLLIGVSFWESDKMPISLWLGKVQTLATGKHVLLIREVSFVHKNFLYKCFGFILCKSKKS